MIATISVLIPSRGRPAGLLNCVSQLFSLAASPSQLEILLRLDFDDLPSIQAASQLRNTYPLLAVVDSRYGGWRDNHRFYNDLARQATGEWLFMYNDDANMLTRNWDVKIRTAVRPVLATRMRKLVAGPTHYWQAHNGMRMGNAFPVVRRDAYAAVGTFSRHSHSDVFWEWLASPLGLQQEIAVDIVHVPTCSVSLHDRGAGWRQDFSSEPLCSQLQRDRDNLTKLARS